MGVVINVRNPVGESIEGMSQKEKMGRGPPVPPEAHPLSATKGKIVGIGV